MQESPTLEINPEEIKRYELAVTLTKETLRELDIEDISSYTKKDFSGFKSSFYKMESERNVKIYAEVGYEFGLIKLEFSLVVITNHIIEFLDKVLSNEEVSEILKPSVIYELDKRDIDILTLFDLDESKVQEEIQNKTKSILKLFIKNIDLFTRASVIDALGHSITGYYQHVIKESLKDHWAKLGLPGDFSLLTQSDLDEIRQYNVDRKRWFIGDKKQLLNDWRLEGLADEADNLRGQYKIAKSRYKELKHSFELIYKRASREDWLEKWIDWQIEEFSALNCKALDLIEEKPPFELAIVHLADLFGYDAETMRKKITESRKLKKQKLKAGNFEK